MPWVIAFMVYVIVWSLVLFTILPIGVVPDPEGDADSGGWRGAPKKTYLGRKLIATTLVAGLVWCGIEALVVSDWLSFRTGYWSMPIK